MPAGLVARGDHSVDTGILQCPPFIEMRGRAYSSDSSVSAFGQYFGAGDTEDEAEHCRSTFQHGLHLRSEIWGRRILVGGGFQSDSLEPRLQRTGVGVVDGPIEVARLIG